MPWTETSPVKTFSSPLSVRTMSWPSASTLMAVPLPVPPPGKSKVTWRLRLTQAALYSSRKGAKPSRAKV